MLSKMEEFRRSHCSSEDPRDSEEPRNLKKLKNPQNLILDVDE